MGFFSADQGFSKELGILEAPGSPSFTYNENHLRRMNAREQAIMRPIAGYLQGARVLDLGSHDGRWSWAALKYGAAHVTGIEWRQEAIDFGMPLFKGMAHRYTAIQGDVSEVLSTFPARSFDVILNLGIFYHVMDHYRLLRLTRDLQPKIIVLDSALMNSDETFIRVETEDTRHIMNAAPDTGGDRQENVRGIVSRGALEMMCRALGLSYTYVPWRNEDHPNKEMIKDYFGTSPGRKRFTLQLKLGAQ